MRLVLPYPPSANRYWKTWRGRAVKSPEAKAYTLAVGGLCKVARAKPLDGPISVEISVYRPLRRGDLDNRIKVTLDALRGHAFADDDQVVELHAYRYDDKARPRVEVEVTPAVLEDKP